MAENTPENFLSSDEMERLRRLREALRGANEETESDTPQVLQSRTVSAVGTHLNIARELPPCPETDETSAFYRIRSLTRQLSIKMLLDKQTTIRESSPISVADISTTETQFRIDKTTVLFLTRTKIIGIIGVEQINVLSYHWPEGTRIEDSEEKAKFSVSDSGSFNAQFVPYSQDPDRKIKTITHYSGYRFQEDAEVAFEAFSALTQPYLDSEMQ